MELEKIREICERVAGSLGLEIVDIEFRGGAGKQGRILRIFIDRVEGAQPRAAVPSEPGTDRLSTGETPVPHEQGITIDDCANVSREVSTILDVEDAIPGSEYVLEVSSPGLDRKLSRAKDFERFVGSRLKVMTYMPVGVTEISKGNRHFEGKLESFTGEKLTLDVNAPKRKAKPSKHKAEPLLVEIEFGNVEKANLVPEF